MIAQAEPDETDKPDTPPTPAAYPVDFELAPRARPGARVGANFTNFRARVGSRVLVIAGATQ
jgi:hypothetical protein